MRDSARRRLPKGVFDYIDGGAEDELTMRRNTSDYQDLMFAPRVLTGLRGIDTTTRLLDSDLAFPVVLAPTGFTRIAHPDGELAVARAAARAGIPYTLSTLSTFSIEDVTAEGGDVWFQLYVWRDRGLVRDLIDRAAEARCTTLCVTVDTAVLGRRERDVRSGFKLPPRIGVGTLLDAIAHPRWAWRSLTSEQIVFANVRGQAVGDGTDAITLSEYVNSQFDPTLSWDDVAWIQSEWDGPLVIKGIQSPADARFATALGVDAIVLSNHGGRQLDSAPTPLSIIRDVTEVVEGDAAVLVDGGVRRGSDVVKSLALGASAVMMGRPYLYGLGALGEAGVDHVLELFRSDIERVMALIGVDSIDRIGPEMVRGVGSSGATR